MRGEHVTTDSEATRQKDSVPYNRNKDGGMMGKSGVWHMQRQQWRSALAILTVLAVVVITGGTSLAGTSEVRERVSLDLAPTISGVTGEAEFCGYVYETGT